MRDSNYSDEQTGRLVAMGQMAASLAHEIRNPLGSMELYCSVLKREVRDDEGKLELVNHIQQGINSLSHIVSNCLVFTKDVSVRKQKYHSAEVFLSETCRYVSSANEHLAVITGSPDASGADGLYLSWKESGAEPFMMDAYVLGQILLNLTRNALDACSENTDQKKKFHVEVEVIHSDSACWILSVRDNGKGMSREVMEKIYDPFFTTREKGTGLGLAIVHSLVKAHDGKMTVDSVESEGTEIRIEFLN